MTGFLTDLRFAVRSLARNPGFSLAVILALALGLGASTAIFSVLWTVALRPLPWSEPDRIVSFNEVHPELPEGRSSGAFHLSNVREFRDRARSFDGIAAYHQKSLNLTEGDQPRRLQAGAVTADLFKVLGVSPERGRTFEAAEVEAGESRLVVLSRRALDRYFGGDETKVGEAITLDGEPYTVLGVMPSAFAFPDEEIEAWVPLVWNVPERNGQRAEIMLPVIARLADGVTPEQAEAESDTLLAELQRESGLQRQRTVGGQRGDRGAGPGPSGAPESGTERRIVRRGPDAEGRQDPAAQPPGSDPASGGGERVVRRRVSPGADRGEEPGAQEEAQGGSPGGHGPQREAGHETSTGDSPPSTLELRTLRDQQIEPIRPAMRVLIGAVGLVLLIACANVANLLLTRGLQRRRELATRAALGAGRGGLSRLLFTESLVLAFTGCAVGLFLAWIGLRALRRLDPGDIPRLDEVALHPQVVLFAVLLALACAALFALVPSVQTRLSSLLSSLGREAGPIVGGKAVGQYLRGGLAVAEIGLALILLVGASLLGNSFLRLINVDAGFDPEGVVATQLTLPPAQYPPGEARDAFFVQLLERLRALPDVESAGLVNFLPPVQGRIVLSVQIDSQAPPENPAEAPQGDLRVVSDGYLETMGILLLDGRTFTPADRAGAPGAVVINQSFADRYFEDGRVLGERLAMFGEIVGVVSDVRAQGPESDPEPTFYLPLAQAPEMMASLFQRMSVVAKTDRPDAVIPALGDVVHSIDPNLPLDEITTMEARVSEAVAMPRFYATVISVFAGLAVLLALFGVYGVLSFLVSQRSRETGIRMALGAQRSQVLRETLWHGLRLALIGVAIGSAGAWGLRNLLGGMLFGIEAEDPGTFLGVAVALMVIAAIACWLPARRAAGADPALILRNE